MSDLTYADLDDMVEGDPIATRDRVWAELQRLHALIGRLTTRPTDPMQVIALGQARHLIRDLDAQLATVRAERDEAEGAVRDLVENYAATDQQAFEAAHARACAVMAAKDARRG